MYLFYSNFTLTVIFPYCNSWTSIIEFLLFSNRNHAISWIQNWLFVTNVKRVVFHVKKNHVDLLHGHIKLPPGDFFIIIQIEVV